MTYTDFLPPEIYRFLLNTAHDRKLSIKEVEMAFLRKVLKEYGWKCRHELVKLAKSNNLPYCSGCYQRMTMIKPPRYVGRMMIQPGTYAEIKDCIEEIEALK